VNSSGSLLNDETLQKACRDLSKNFLEALKDEVIKTECDEAEESKENSVEVSVKVSSYDRFSIEVEVPDGLTREEAKAGIEDLLGEMVGNIVYAGGIKQRKTIEEEVERELKERRREYIDDCRGCGTTKVLNENTGEVFCPVCRRKSEIE